MKSYSKIFLNLLGEVILIVVLGMPVILFPAVELLKNTKEKIIITSTLESYKRLQASIENERTARLKYVDDSFNDCVAKEGFDKCVNLSSLTKDFINDSYNEISAEIDNFLLDDIGGLSVIEKFGLVLIEKQTP